jgi:predicted nucleotidyltransferase
MVTNIRSRLEISDEQLIAFCEKWQIEKLEVFGSALRNDFGPHSDIDVLVTFAADAHWTLFDVVHAEDDFKQLIGRKVDLIERSAIEESPNWIRRKHILGTARVIYAA